MDAHTNKPIRRILLSNDDGIDAIGLEILHDIASQFSDDVWVIAPSENRSGASRSITLRQDVVIQQIGPKRYSCTGTPADCIIFGMSQIIFWHSCWSYGGRIASGAGHCHVTASRS